MPSNTHTHSTPSCFLAKFNPTILGYEQANFSSIPNPLPQSPSSRVLYSVDFPRRLFCSTQKLPIFRKKNSLLLSTAAAAADDDGKSSRKDAFTQSGEWSAEYVAVCDDTNEGKGEIGSLSGKSTPSSAKPLAPFRSSPE